MVIKLGDIKGAVLKKEILREFDGWAIRDMVNALNENIDRQSEVCIGLNREKLAFIIWKQNKEIIGHWNLQKCEEVADAIIAAESTLLEVKK